MRKKKLIALVLCFALLVVFCLPMAVSAKTAVSYVALGDSTANGYGFDGYYGYFTGSTYTDTYGYGLSLEGTYPVSLAEDLGADLTSLTYSGLRTSDLRYLLDESYEGDQFTKRFFIQGRFARNYNLANGTTLTTEEVVAALRNEYTTAIANADVITFGVGGNDFGNYVVGRLAGLLGIYDYKDDDHVEDLCKKPAIAKTVSALRTSALKLLKSAMSDETASAVASELIDALLYAYVNYTEQFVYDYQAVRELNPDAELIFVSYPNILDDWNIHYNGRILPLGSLLDLFITSINKYQATVTAKDEHCYVATFDNHITTFADELKEGNISTDLYNRLVEMIALPGVQAADPSITPAQLQAAFRDLDEKGDTSAYYATLGEAHTAFCTAVTTFRESFASEELNFNLLFENIEVLSGLFNSDTPIEDAAALIAQGGDVAETARQSLYFYTRVMLADGMLSHPNKAGHEQMKNAILSAYQNNRTSYYYLYGRYPAKCTPKKTILQKIWSAIFRRRR